jgi:hypothetical protein
MRLRTSLIGPRCSGVVRMMSSIVDAGYHALLAHQRAQERNDLIDRVVAELNHL